MRLQQVSKVMGIVVLLIVLFSFAMFEGGFTSWFLFYSFLPIFLYQIGLLFYSTKNWRVTRELSHQTVKAGDEVTVNLMVYRKFPFPIYYCICEEVFPESLNKHDLKQGKYQYMSNEQVIERQRHIKQIVFPFFKRTFSMSYKLSNIPRGEHEFSRVRIRTAGLFGLIEKENIIETQDKILVYSNKRKLYMKEQAETFEQGPMTSHAFNLKNTNVASGIRDYAPGDRFTWIDWKQTARKGEMMTKEFEQEKSTDTLIILDSVEHKHVNDIAFEATVELGASLLDMFKRHATEVGLLTVSEESVFFPAQDYLMNNDMVQRHLATIQPEGSGSFPSQLKKSLVRIKNQYLTIIVTTSLDNELKETLSHLKMQGKRLVLIYVQAQADVTQTDLSIIKDLSLKGIDVSLMSENDLTKDIIEVKRF